MIPTDPREIERNWRDAAGAHACVASDLIAAQRLRLDLHALREAVLTSDGADEAIDLLQVIDNDLEHNALHIDGLIAELHGLEKLALVAYELYRGTKNISN